jgi:hypothetical protein
MLDNVEATTDVAFPWFRLDISRLPHYTSGSANVDILRQALPQEATMATPRPVRDTERKLRSFAALQPGWHYGEGGPIEGEILDDAIALNRYALHLGFARTNAFPGLNGEARVTIYDGEHYLEFTVEPDRAIDYYHELDGQRVSRELGLSVQSAKDRIWGFWATTRWRTTSGSSITTDSTIRTGDSSRA